ncbi:MAG: DUF1887 family protein [Eubacterium sp.]|nr:DUF1887 family protein [Eubacterium sp.]
MTYIEFFDKSVTENIYTTLANPPEKLILVGSDKEWLKEHKKRYSALFKSKSISTNVSFKVINHNNLNACVDEISRIVEDDDECVFDLTGGNDLYLVAVGIVYEKYKNKKVKMHRVDIATDTVYDCDFDGVNVIGGNVPGITVKDMINICGGKVIPYADDASKGTYEWNMTPDFKDDIKKMWSISKLGFKDWNKLIRAFAKGVQDDTKLTATCSSNAIDNLKTNRTINSIIKDLEDSAFIKIKRVANDYEIAFKDKQVKRCLTKEGQILEMIVYIYACESGYNSVMNGVYIDWDGVLHTYDTDVFNEIDVICMHNMVPVFISCKNGNIESDELFKLKTVAKRFGGKYSKKVIISTSLESTDSKNALRERAKEMDIAIIEIRRSTRDSDFRVEIGNLWHTAESKKLYI